MIVRYINVHLIIIIIIIYLYCRAALQRSDRKEPRYKWPTLLYFTLRKYPGSLKVNTFLLLALGFYLNPTIDV